MQDSTPERRRDDRLPVIWNGTVTLTDDSTHACRVTDISLAGTLVECAAPVAIGDELILSVPSLGEFAGKVRWTGKGCFGLALEAGPELYLKKVAEDGQNFPELAAGILGRTRSID